MPEVIANTSPLQYLHQAGQLGLLPRLFTRITVAGAVVEELARGRGLGLDLPVPEQLAWADLRHPGTPAGALLAWDLGAGESETLSLALERPGAWVILDDRLARRAAAVLRVPCLGTAGVLLRAKGAGHLAAVGPVLGELNALGFRLTAETRRRVLTLAGE